MNSENNSNNLFNRLPASTLSTIFVLAQNPQLSLLNKNMYKASQKVETVSDYILQYALSNTENSFTRNLSDMFEKYTKINMNEAIVILVFRKIKNVEYEFVLRLAFYYEWRNILNKLLRMYVVIDRSTSTIVYKGTLSMNENENENEYLDINIRSLFSEEDESHREAIDIKISDHLYIRPIIITQPSLPQLIIEINTKFEKDDVEALIHSWDSKIKIPTELAGSDVVEVKFIDSKDITCIVLNCVYTICKLNSLDLLKRILDLKINTNFSSKKLKSHKMDYDMISSMIPTYFIEKYGYETKIELLVYLICSYYAIEKERREMVKFLENNYPDVIHQQILFDAAVYHRKEELIKEFFFKTEPNSGNISKITEMAYRNDNVNLIRFLLNNCDKLKGGLDENALKTAIKKKEYELAQDIISKYPNTVCVSCLAGAVGSGDIRITKLLVESGADLKSPEFEGILIACEDKDMNMLQLLLENGALVSSNANEAIEMLCSINNYEIAKRLIESFDRGWVKFKTSGRKPKVGTRITFNKTVLCLIEAIQSYYQTESYNSYEHNYENDADFVYYGDHIEFDVFREDLDLYERIMLIKNSKKRDYTNSCALYLRPPSDFGYVIQLISKSHDELGKIVEYIHEDSLKCTLSDAEYSETNESEYDSDVEVLNDRHYELVKSELVNRNFKMLRLLIEYGMDINLADSLILKTAYKAGDIDWIDYFVSKGAKLEGESDGFEEACRSNKVEVLKHWIKNGGVIPKNPEYSCINMACLLDNFDMVKLLVENGVDLSDPTRNGVRIACRLGLKKTLKYLLENNAEIKGVCHHQLEYACIIEDVGLVKMILEYYDGLGVLERKDKTDSKEGEEFQHDSFLDNVNPDRSEEYRITKILIEKGKPIQNSDLLDGIKAAAILANTEILRLLLNYKIDLDDDFKLSELALQLKNIEVLNVLLKNGLSVKSNTELLEIAFKAENTEMVKLLLRHGAKVNKYSDSLRQNPMLDDIETLQLLLNNCPEIVGDSNLLKFAIEKNNLEAVKLLLKDTCPFGIEGSYYVYYACKNNTMDILKLLFEKGAKIEIGHKSGVNEACENNNLEMLKLLFEKVPNLVLNRNLGLKASIKHKSVEMIKLLIKHGADTSLYIESIVEVANEMNDHELINICQKMDSRN